tara:strand:- start:14771 stop:15022 length:252 start_codon:yes stop_codon:yes gene_type:complete
MSKFVCSPIFRGKYPQKDKGSFLLNSKPLTENDDTREQGPGILKILRPMLRQWLIILAPGSQIAGVPASQVITIISFFFLYLG